MLGHIGRMEKWKLLFWVRVQGLDFRVAFSTQGLLCSSLFKILW